MSSLSFATLLIGQPRPRARLAASWRLPASLASLVSAFLPFVLVEGRSLWLSPHYQFFPLVLVGSAVLLRRGIREVGDVAPGERRDAWLLLSLAWLLLLLAISLFSVWLGVVAGMAALLAVSYDLGGRALLVRILPAWLFLGLALPPPLGLDTKAIVRLQLFATTGSSSLLDLLGVFHAVEGNTVNVSGRRLLIEEACSGIHSLLAATTCVLFGVLWVRRSFTRGVLLVAAGVFWVLLGNLLRIVIVVWLVANHGIAADTGWRHEAIGALMFVLALALTASTDRLLAALSELGRRAHATIAGTRPGVVRLRTSTLAHPQTGDAAPPPDAAVPARSPARFATTALASWPVPLAFGLLAVVQLVGSACVLSQVSWSEDGISRRLQVLSARSLPRHSGAFDRGAYAVTNRESGSLIGRRSQTWNYRGSGHHAVVSIDSPFWGWHELSACYEGLGWTVAERRILHDSGGSRRRGDIVAVALTRPSGRYGFLLYALEDDRGRPVEAPRTGLRMLSSISDRIARVGEFAASGDISCVVPRFMTASFQIQLFIERDVPLDAGERTRARDLFEDVLSTIDQACFRTGRGRDQRS